MVYKIYTTELDEVVRPLDLHSEKDLLKRAEDFHKLCPVEDFEPLRERLAALQAPDESTVVTILIDNSGSMRGHPITFAVGAVGIISMYLDRLGIPNEILGFTTKSWRGGDAREKWLDNGRPKNPGRLNALRHIVYKQVDEKLQDVRHYLACMMMEGILKENIDGEAVQWACERLRSHDAKRKILLVLSDGAPIDDSTLTIHPPSYLEDHLRKVITQLNKDGDILLDAIGLANYDTSRYLIRDVYGVGDMIEQLEDLAPTALTKLEHLLKKERVPSNFGDVDAVMRNALSKSTKKTRTIKRDKKNI